MKSDAAYLTEHVAGIYVCPSQRGRRRHNRKKRRKDLRHTHTTLAEINLCIANCLTEKLRRKYARLQDTTMAGLIAAYNGMAEATDLLSVLIRLINQLSLYRCETERNLFKRAAFPTGALREADEKVRQSDLKTLSQLSNADIQAIFTRLGQKKK